MKTFPAVTHVAVTVTDLSVSVPWYNRLFGADPVLDEDTGPFRHVVWAIGDMLYSLHGFPDGRPAGGFDPVRPGLDHVAFAAADRADLERWKQRLEELSVPHGGIIDAHYGSALAFKDPDGIALEFFAAPASQ
jgi:glyoxylase I family protein